MLVQQNKYFEKSNCIPLIKGKLIEMKAGKKAAKKLRLK